jgi:hypothetical protein
MARILLAAYTLILMGSAYAVDVQDAPPSVGMGGIILFLVLFVGMCVAFVWMVMRNDKKRKADEAAPKSGV